MGDSNVSGLPDSEDCSTAESDDRLSELPDALILVILSLLPMRDVVATTFLSKRWLDLWTTTPCLHFWDRTYNLHIFRTFVSRFLSIWKGSKILKFSIDFLFDVPLSDDLDSWLHFAIEKQVEELYVNLVDPRFDMLFPDTEYCPPHSLYSCSSIKKLSLLCCKLVVCECPQWKQLKSLRIQFEYLSEQDMDLLLCGAPQLEVLDICTLENSHNCCIRSNRLKMLKIERRLNDLSFDSVNNTSLTVWAPNLETLELVGASYGKHFLKVPSLTNAVIGLLERDYGRRCRKPCDEMVSQIILSILHVERITLSDWFIKVVLKMRKMGMVGVFPNAKYLKLKASEAYEMVGVMGMFPKLVVLNVELSESKNELFVHVLDKFISLNVDPRFIALAVDPESVYPSAPMGMFHLRSVEITWHAINFPIVSAMGIVLANSPALEKMVFRPEWRGENCNLLHFVREEVLSLPRSSPVAEVTLLEDLVT